MLRTVLIAMLSVVLLFSSKMTKVSAAIPATSQAASSRSSAMATSQPTTRRVVELSRWQGLGVLTGLMAWGLFCAYCGYVGSKIAREHGRLFRVQRMRFMSIAIGIGVIALYLAAIVFVLQS